MKTATKSAAYLPAETTRPASARHWPARVSLQISGAAWPARIRRKIGSQIGRRELRVLRQGEGHGAQRGRTPAARALVIEQAPVGPHGQRDHPCRIQIGRDEGRMGQDVRIENEQGERQEASGRSIQGAGPAEHQPPQEKRADHRRVPAEFHRLQTMPEPTRPERRAHRCRERVEHREGHLAVGQSRGVEVEEPPPILVVGGFVARQRLVTHASGFQEREHEEQQARGQNRAVRHEARGA